MDFSRKIRNFFTPTAMLDKGACLDSTTSVSGLIDNTNNRIFPHLLTQEGIDIRLDKSSKIKW